ncbi:MAG TPA: dienelactone hydrolase family protein [Rhodanobacteraceae bacterium]|nr:dienelactone hydrolase family protein [Rhodanobacteraceae bacterium]
MTREAIIIETRDGRCPASVFTPTESRGPWPGVLFFMDGLGIRPSMWEMGQRLADAGYLVLLPDLYYREGSYAPMDPSEVFSAPDARERLKQLVGSLTRERKIADATAFTDTLADRADVAGKRFGATGYCMGGNCALTAAGALPERFAAVASFHGGSLATDSPDSPHRFVDGITGRVYVAGAIEDAHFTDAEKQQLEDALTEAGVTHEVVTYEHARHGFAVPDMPVYSPEAAERHWDALLKLFGESL